MPPKRLYRLRNHRTGIRASLQRCRKRRLTLLASAGAAPEGASFCAEFAARLKGVP